MKNVEKCKYGLKQPEDIGCAFGGKVQLCSAKALKKYKGEYNESKMKKIFQKFISKKSPRFSKFAVIIIL